MASETEYSVTMAGVLTGNVGRRMVGLIAPDGVLFSFVQPGDTAGEPFDRTFEQPGTVLQRRKHDLRILVALGHRIIQPQRVVLDELYDSAERMGFDSSWLLHLRQGAIGC